MFNATARKDMKKFLFIAQLPVIGGHLLARIIFSVILTSAQYWAEFQIPTIGHISNFRQTPTSRIL